MWSQNMGNSASLSGYPMRTGSCAGTLDAFSGSITGGSESVRIVKRMPGPRVEVRTWRYELKSKRSFIMKDRTTHFLPFLNKPTSWLKLAIFVVALAPVLAGCSSAKDSSQNRSITEGTFDPTYSGYAVLLSSFVKGDQVDYEGLEDEKDELEKVVAGFAALTQDSLKAMSESKQIAFYSNAYNAITLYSIVERYPDLKSIKDISGVWDKREWDVAGERLTLNDIEHKKLRVDYDEPRIHFAINCASTGCPPLNDAPFTGSALEEQLSERTQSFFNDTERFRYDSESGTLYVTKIFKWFGDDFLSNNNPRPKSASLSQKEAAIVAFIAARLPEELSREILNGAKSIKYLDYDWDLNDIDK
jgi:Protein of unknown function, DUF547